MKQLYLIFLLSTSIPSFINSQGWFQQNSGTFYNLNSVFFVDVNTGYVVGDSASGHIILKTTNGGLNWIRQSPLPPANSYPLGSVFFLDANTGYAAGGVSSPGIRIIYKTTNGGSSWNQLYFESSIYRFTSLYFINSNTGICTGSAYTTSAGYIFRTTNGGTAWSYQYSIGSVLYSVHFIDANTGYACGMPGIIIKTTNAGLNWVQQTSSTAAILRSIYFINALTGWAAGQGLYSVYFANDQTGWVCGCEAAIHGTKNGGANWVMQSFASTTYLYSMRFVSATTGWAVGTGGKILKTTTGGVTALTTVSNEIPDRFYLFQNYPNPFNPVTKIKFDIPLLRGVDADGGRGVLLVIYDILGREITTIVNEQLQPGTYEVEWPAPTGDAYNYSSGVYYYKLAVGDYKETKKMILIK